MKNKLKVSRFKLRNILGITEYEFEPGTGYTEILGPNGVGKTSLLEAFKALGTPGHDATLLTEGQSEGEIVWVLDDGTQIEKNITTKKTDLVVRNGVTKKKEESPAAIVRSLLDTLSNNPIELLTAKPKERVKVLLESMPIIADCARLTEISGIEVKDVPGVHGLYLIDTTHDQVFDARTGTNRAIKEKQGTIKQLRAVMPEAVPGAEGGEDVLEAEIDALDAAKDAELLRIDNKLAAIRTDSQAKIDQIKADAGSEIEALRQQIADRQATEAADVEAERSSLQSIEQKASTQRNLTIEQHAIDRQPFRSQLDAIKANRETAAKREQAIKTIETMEEELQVLREEADGQTAALASIDAYKLELLAGLPIPGLEVRGEQIYRDNVLFERLNTQKKVDIAIDLAKLRAGPLGLICVDGLECLDTPHYEAFKQRAIDDPTLQFVGARVTDGEFEVRTM